MIVVQRTRTVARARPVRRWALVVVMTALVAGALGSAFVTGYFANENGYAREFLRVTLATVQHPLNYVQALIASEDLPTLRIDMPMKQLHKIEESRAEAVRGKYLLSRHAVVVPATATIDDTPLRVKMRLKGVLDDHRSTRKWSFRIHAEDDEVILGMRKLSIQHPVTRSYLDEWLYLETLRAEELLAPRYGFLQVVFNGTPKGIYAFEEHVAKEFLESQRRRDGVVLKIDDEDFWLKQLPLGRKTDSVFPTSFDNAEIVNYAENRTARNPVLRRQRDAGVRLLLDFMEGRRESSEVFDIELTSRFLAVHELWGSQHPLGAINARFYVNALSGRLEPIGGDAMADFRHRELVALPPLHADRTDVRLSHLWPPQYLQDPIAAEAYVREVVRVSQPEFLSQLREQLGAQGDRYLSALHREYPDVTAPWPQLEERQNELRRLLDPPRAVIAYGDHELAMESDGQGELVLRVGNVLALPVEVIGFVVGDGPLLRAQTTVTPPDDGDRTHWIIEGRDSIVLPGKAFDQPIRFARFRLGDHVVDPATAPSIKVVARLLGHTVDKEIGVRLAMQVGAEEGLPSPPSWDEALARYPFLAPGDGERVLRIKTGEWRVDGDLVLPSGATVEAGPGTELRFAPGAVFVATGPMQFQGTADAPIVLAPIEDSWSGLANLGSAAASRWEHVEVFGTLGVDRPGWFLTGGTTFYKTPVTLEHCRFEGSRAEDSLNVIGGQFEFRNTRFVDCASDAFDGDFTSGSILSSTFERVGGDAIDVSGSQLTVRRVEVEQVGDKAVSVGEDSHAELVSVAIVGARFGVVSKDLSSINIEDLAIGGSEYGVAAFVKKQEFGPATVRARGLEFSNVRHETLVGEGSWVVLNGRRTNGKPIDVEALYDPPTDSPADPPES